MVTANKAMVSPGPVLVSWLPAGAVPRAVPLPAVEPVGAGALGGVEEPLLVDGLAGWFFVFGLAGAFAPWLVPVVFFGDGDFCALCKAQAAAKATTATTSAVISSRRAVARQSC